MGIPSISCSLHLDVFLVPSEVCNLHKALVAKLSCSVGPHCMWLAAIWSTCSDACSQVYAVAIVRPFWSKREAEVLCDSQTMQVCTVSICNEGLWIKWDDSSKALQSSLFLDRQVYFLFLSIRCGCYVLSCCHNCNIDLNRCNLYIHGMQFWEAMSPACLFFLDRVPMVWEMLVHKICKAEI